MTKVKRRCKRPSGMSIAKLCAVASKQKRRQNLIRALTDIVDYVPPKPQTRYERIVPKVEPWDTKKSRKRRVVPKVEPWGKKRADDALPWYLKPWWDEDEPEGDTPSVLPEPEPRKKAKPKLPKVPRKKVEPVETPPEADVDVERFRRLERKGEK